MSQTRKPKRVTPTSEIVVAPLHRFYTSYGYRSTTIANREGRSYSGAAGEYHDERDREKLVRESRYFMRNNEIYRGMIGRAVSYIVGNGFVPQVTSKNKAQANKIEQLWKAWFKRPEVRGLLSGRKTSRMILREVIVTGDVTLLKVQKDKQYLIQIFESEQLKAQTRNKYLAGIQRDATDTPTRFRLCPWNGISIDDTKATTYRADQVLFLSNPERPSSVRGVPACQAAFPMLHRISDVCDAEAIAWQLLSRLAVTINRQAAEEKAYKESKDDQSKTTTQKEGDLATRVSELDYALLFHAQPGEEIKGIERNIPGQQFSESLRMFLRLLGLPIGLPLELILLDWTQSNYSQSRAVLEQAYESFAGWQQDLIEYIYQPLFDWKLTEWQNSPASGIHPRTKINVTWVTPSFPWIDPLKEAQAYGEQLDRGLITHGEVCKSRHSDREEIIERRDKEIRDAIERAQKIKEDTDVDVPWQIFAGLKTPKAATPAGARGKPNQTTEPKGAIHAISKRA